MKLEDYFDTVCQFFEQNFYDGDTPIVSKINLDLSNGVNIKGHEHNCIGCNLSNSINQIYFYLQTVPTEFGKEYPHKIFFYLNYLLVEQLQFLYSLFEKRGYLRDNDVFSSKYPNFMKMKRWTNFFKHPKYFMLVHHPDFTFEADDEYEKLIQDLENVILIDDNFVRKFYRGEGNRERLFRRIANKADVIVIFPDLRKLIKGFHNDLERFIQNVTEDEDYMRIMNEEATFENYFEFLDEEE